MRSALTVTLAALAGLAGGFMLAWTLGGPAPGALLERLPGVSALLGERGVEGGRARPAPQVPVARVERRSVPVTQSHSGRLVARRRVELRARVTGYVEERAFAEAAFVEAGAVLYRLDRRPIEARIAELEASRDGARERLAFLETEVARVRQLEGEEFATESRLDELVAERAQAGARVRELEAALRRARLDLDYATVEAPFAGRTGFTRVDEGDLVAAGETVLTTLVEYDPVEVEFRPSAPQLAEMSDWLERSGDAISVSVALESGETAGEGEIAALGPAFERTTNTIAVRAELPNPDSDLVPGQFVRVTARLGAREALTVPSEALVVNQDRRAVYRISGDGTAEIVPVETGAEADGRTVVRGALAAGERIATGRLQALRPGIAVEPVEPAGDGPAAGGGRAAR